MATLKGRMAGVVLAAASGVFAGCASGPGAGDTQPPAQPDDSKRIERTLGFVACVQTRKDLLNKELQTNKAVAQAARNPQFVQYVVVHSYLNCFTEVTNVPREKLIEESKGSLTALRDRYLDPGLYQRLLPE